MVVWQVAKGFPLLIVPAAVRCRALWETVHDLPVSASLTVAPGQLSKRPSALCVVFPPQARLQLSVVNRLAPRSARRISLRAMVTTGYQAGLPTLHQCFDDPKKRIGGLNRPRQALP